MNSSNSKSILRLRLKLLFFLLIPLFLFIMSGFVSAVPPSDPDKVAFTGDDGLVDVKVMQQSKNVVIIDVKVKSIKKEEVKASKKKFQRFSISGYKTTYDVGKAELPAIRELIAIPDGASTTVKVIESKSYIVKGVDVYPFQPPLVDGQMPGQKFVIDKDFYSRDSFYPASSTQIEKPAVWRDITVAGVTINPILYNPFTKEIKVYKHIKLKIQFSGGKFKKKKISKKFAAMYRKELKNFDSLDFIEEVPDNYIPSVNDASSTTLQKSPLPETMDTAVDQTVGSGPSLSSTVTSSSVKILSIRHTSCSTYSTLFPLLDWHRRCGLPFASVIKSGTPDAQSIKDTIVSYYNSHPELEYVILVGDIDYIPWQDNWDGDAWPENLPGDHWYACVTGGSTPDLYADLAIGRLPCKNDTELQQMVTKILDYSTNPPTGSWPNKAILMSHKENAPNKYQGCSEEIRTETYSADSFNFVTAYGASTANGGDERTNAELVTEINSGAGILNYRGHGGWSDISGPPYGEFWGTNWNTSWQEFTRTNAAGLNTGGKLPVVFSISCTNAWLDADNDTLGEEFFKGTDGAVAFLGASRPSYTTPNHDFDKSLFTAIGTNQTYNIGWTLNSANAAILNAYGTNSTAGDNVRMYLWLGDPAMEMRTSGTAYLYVTHPSSVADGVMTVTVKNILGYGVSGALVNLDGQGVYTQKYTNSSGQATFNFIPTGTGTMDVTVTKHNYRAYQGSAQIVPLQNAINNITFNPTSPSSLCIDEYVYGNYDYTTDDPGGIQIFMRPYTNGALTPGYAAHGSGWYPYPSGSASGYFRIKSGNPVIDQIRFQIYNHDQSQLLLEIFEPVHFTYGHAVYDIEMDPASPATMKWDERVNISFNYHSCDADGMRIFFTPMTNGSPTPGRATSGSPLYSKGTGSGTAYFRITSGQRNVDQVRVKITNADQSQTYSESLINVDYDYEGYPDLAVSPTSLDINLTGSTTWTGTLNVLNNGAGALHYGLRDRHTKYGPLAPPAAASQSSPAVPSDQGLDSDPGASDGSDPTDATIIIPPIILPPWIFIVQDLRGVTIGFDLSHGELNPSQIDSVKEYLIARGAKINYITTGPVTAAMLENYDILWVYEGGGSAWTTAEKDDISAWVRNGRGLLVYGDQPGTATSLTSQFGINYLTADGTSGYSGNIASHSITDNVDEVYLPGPLMTLSAGSGVDIPVRDAGNVPSVACNTLEDGRGTVMADDYFWGAYSEYGDNWILGKNIFTWLTPPDSTWLDQNPKSGTVEVTPGTTAIDLDIDATTLLSGDYYADITITSDDPDGIPAIVPVHLNVAPKVTLTNIVATPASPALVKFGDNVSVTFDYESNVGEGVKIYARPLTNGSLTPNYGGHGSPVYPNGTDKGDGYFTITSGKVTVDQIRLQIKKASDNTLIDEVLVDVDYTFADYANVGVSVVLEGPKRPDPAGWQIPLEVKFFKPGAKVLLAAPEYEFNATTKKNGVYASCQVGYVEAKNYDVTVQSANSLMNVKRNTAITSPLTNIIMGTMQFGDSLPDDVIDLNDLAVMSKTWMLSRDSRSFNPAADCDRNGYIDIFDLRLMVEGWLDNSPLKVP